MTLYNQEITNAAGDNPTHGDDVSVVREITGLTTAQVIDTAWLTLKERVSDADAAAVLQLVITTALTSDGQITDDGTGATEGEITFTIKGGDGDYANIVAGRPYNYDIRTKLGDGTVTTLEQGQVRWEKPVTQDTS